MAVRRDGAVVVPKLFFDDTGHVVKSLSGLLVVLHDGGYHDTEIMRWLFTPDPSLIISRDGATERRPTPARSTRCIRIRPARWCVALRRWRTDRLHLPIRVLAPRAVAASTTRPRRIRCQQHLQPGVHPV